MPTVVTWANSKEPDTVVGPNAIVEFVWCELGESEVLRTLKDPPNT